MQTQQLMLESCFQTKYQKVWNHFWQIVSLCFGLSFMELQVLHLSNN